MSGAIRRIVLAATGVVLLSSCQLDVAVDVVVEPDGTGTITVVTSADADIVEQVPTIADELVLDDIVSAGWNVDGPAPTPAGGLIITMSHDFESAAEATNLLRSLGPPFNAIKLGRGTNGDITTNQIGGRLGLPDGFESFADEDLITAVGSVPFADEIAASGATPGTAISATIRARLPGDLVSSETNATVLPDGTLEWVSPTDATVLEWSARTEQAPSEGGVWAKPVSVAALIALMAWVGFMVLFIVFVAFVRWRKARAYRRRPIHQQPPVDIG